ncbi:MAG: VOC family protein [Bacteroidetes bacterium]|nr:MAG: VOC family protein [Bacteroidota bacterium]
MNQRLAHIAIIVDDYDKAILYYTNVLNFELIEDTVLSITKRWVLVKPSGSGTCSLLLAKAVGEEQKRFIGNQSGGRVFLFLHTDDFQKDYQMLINRKVEIVKEASEQEHGTVAVFKDIYGNLWDLIQPNHS